MASIIVNGENSFKLMKTALTYKDFIDLYTEPNSENYERLKKIMSPYTWYHKECQY